MTGGPNRSLEDLLRERLHEMDAVDPPDGDLEFRALRAGRERLRRRQAWTRGLVGAAAAVVIGALAIPSLGRLDVSGSGGTSGASVASAPEAATGGSAQDLKAPGAPPAGNDSAGQGSSGGAASVQATVDSLTQTLRQGAYAKVFTALTYESSGAGQVVVHLTREDPGAMALVRSAFPNGPPVVFAQSAYTLAQCQQLETDVQGNILYLRDRGIPLLSTACNADGRVVVEISGTDTEKAIVEDKYGDMVVVTLG